MAQTFSNRSAASTMNGCEAKVVAGNAMAPRKLSLDRRRENKYYSVQKKILTMKSVTAEIHRCTPVARTRYQQCPNKAVYVGISLARAGDAFDASRNNGCGVLRDSIFSCESTAYVQYCPFHEWLVHTATTAPPRPTAQLDREPFSASIACTTEKR